MNTFYETVWKYDKSTDYFSTFRHTPVFERQESRFIDVLNTLKQPKTIMELGIGFGRMTKLVVDFLGDFWKYVGVDISPEQIKRAKDFLGNKRANRICLLENDVMNYNDPKKYEFVLASEILLHILPEHIDELAKKIYNWCDRDFVHIDWARDYEPSNWCFLHDYDSIFTRAGFVLEKEVITDKQSIWHWRVPK